MTRNARNVPFCQSVDLGGHADIMRTALAGGHMSGNGPSSKKCEFLLESALKVPVRLVSSATHALEMMALLARIKPGDEVICPSFTFVSTANAFALHGAEIRFADVDHYGNISLRDVERLISSRTTAVIATDYAGGSADLDALRELCESVGAHLFEDAAQAIGGSYKGRPLGSVGDLGCFSFHETKNIGCGEGGALVIRNTSFLERAEIIREKGTDRAKFFQGLVDKYTWVDLGSSYLLSDLSAAYLYPQIVGLEQITAKRGEFWWNYQRELHHILEEVGIRILETPEYNSQNYHMFGLTFPTRELRSQFIAHMRARSISTPFHYISLHSSPFGSRFHRPEDGELPLSEQFSNCLVRLPIYFNMLPAEQTYVIEAIWDWCQKLRGVDRTVSQHHVEPIAN